MTTIASNDLSASVGVSSTNKFSSKFSIISLGKNDLSASIYPKIASLLSGSIYISPQNHFSFTLDVQPPPKIKVVLTANQDSVVRESVPYFNYGSAQDMYIGYSASLSERYRSLVSFDISSVPTGKPINSAILKVYNDQYFTQPVTANISQVNDSWTELGVDWANQPIDTKLITSLGINPSGGYTSIDVTDLFKSWYNGTTANNGVELSSIDETLQSLVRFYTRESVNPPVLEVTYTETNIPSIGNIELSSSVIPRLTVTNDINGSISLRNVYGQYSISSYITVRLPNMLSSTIGINKPNLNGSITPRLKDNSQLSSTVGVRIKTYKDLISSVLVSQSWFNSMMNVRQSDNSQLTSSITPRISDKLQLTSTITASIPIISGYVNVKSVSQLSSSINIKNQATIDLSSSITAKPQLIGSINVKQFNQLSANIIVEGKINNDLTSSITIRKTDFNNLLSSINSIQLSKIPATILVSSGWLSSSITIPIQATKDMSSSFVARVSWYNDLEVIFGVSSKKGYSYIL